MVPVIIMSHPLELEEMRRFSLERKKRKATSQLFLSPMNIKVGLY